MQQHAELVSQSSGEPLSRLQELLNPISATDFFQSYWERRPVHLKRRDNPIQTGLLSVADLERILVETRPYYPEIRIMSADRGRAWEALDSGWLAPGNPGSAEAMRAVYDAYADGYSIILNMQARWPAVETLRRDLQAAIHLRASAELYLTPPTAQTFPVHYDLHDIFVVQLDGAKRWRVYDPVFPNPALDIAPDRMTPAVDRATERVFDLSEGDLLYVPRGYAHEVSTLGARAMHITFGLFSIRAHDVLTEMVAMLAERDGALRSGFSVPGFEAVTGSAGADALAAALDAMRDPALVEAAHQRLTAKAMSAGRPVLDGHFDALDCLDEIADDTMLERHAAMTCSVEPDAGGVVIHFVGGAVSAPPQAEAALNFIAGADAFRPRDLPGPLNAEGRRVLVRRLIREGILRFEGHAADG